MKLKFELQNYDARLVDEYESEKTDRAIERDINRFNEIAQSMEDEGYEIESIDDYRYEVNDLLEKEFSLLVNLLISEELEVCYISWDCVVNWD